MGGKPVDWRPKFSVHRLGKAERWLILSTIPACECNSVLQSVSRFPKLLEVLTTHVQKPIRMTKKTPHQSTTNTFIWCSNFLISSKMPKARRSSRAGIKLSHHILCSLFSYLETRPGACNCHELWQHQGSVCQESNRSAVRNSPSQQTNLFHESANSLLRLKLDIKLFGKSMTYGSYCPSSSLQTNPTFSLHYMSKSSGSHLSTWRIITSH